MMKNVMAFLMIYGIVFSAFSQVKNVELSEVYVVSANYKYLNAIDRNEVPQPIKILHQEVGNFKLKNANFYEDKFETYNVYFDIPLGRILAVYDQNSKLLRTAEKFNNIKLPIVVSKAVAKVYPGWYIAEDIYLVNYFIDKGVEIKYKILLEKNGKHLWIETDENGNLL